jgi:hypothetical protein
MKICEFKRIPRAAVFAVAVYLLEGGVSVAQTVTFTGTLQSTSTGTLDSKRLTNPGAG